MEAALVRSFAARLQRNLGHLEHGPHTGGLGAGAGASLQCSGDQLLRGEVSEDSLHRQHPGLWLI